MKEVVMVEVLDLMLEVVVVMEFRRMMKEVVVVMVVELLQLMTKDMVVGVGVEVGVVGLKTLKEVVVVVVSEEEEELDLMQ